MVADSVCIQKQLNNWVMLDACVIHSMLNENLYLDLRRQQRRCLTTMPANSITYVSNMYQAWTGDQRHVTRLGMPFDFRVVVLMFGAFNFRTARLYQFMLLSINHMEVDDYDTVEAPSNVPVSSGVWIELILTASAACVRSLCSIYWWSWNHIFLQLRQSKSLEGNFRFSTEDNILLMSAVNIQAHGTQNDKIKIMWIRLGPHAGKPSYGNNVCVCVLREISVSIVRADVPMCVAAGMRTWTHCARN